MGTNRFRVVFVRCVAVAVAVTACLSIIMSVQAYARVGSAETTARAQMQMTSANIASAADSVQMVSAALVNASTTVSNAQAAMTNGATIVQSVSMGMGGAGNTVGFTIPFTSVRPFGNAEDTLKDQAAQVAALADALNRTAASLGTNATDLRMIGAEVAGVATRLREISRSIADFAGDEGGLTKIADAARATAATSIFLSVLFLAVGGALWLLTVGAPTLDEIADAVAARGTERTPQAPVSPPSLEPAEAPPTA